MGKKLDGQRFVSTGLSTSKKHIETQKAPR